MRAVLFLVRIPLPLASAVRYAGAWRGLGRGVAPRWTVWRGEAVLPIAPGAGSRQYVTELTKASAKSNEPKGLNVLVINELAREAEKRTQARYQPWYQSLTEILAPILKKFVWVAPALLRIGGCGAVLAAAQAWEGLPPKPRCPLE